VEALQRPKEFVPLEMLEAIPNPKKTTTEAEIEVLLQEALVSTIAAIDPSLEDSFCTTVATEAMEDPLALQANYIPLDASDMEWNFLNADDDVDARLF
jgi:hypothetical protein